MALKLTITVRSIVLIYLTVLSSCSENESVMKLPKIETMEVSNVTLTSLISGGRITVINAERVTARGVIWGRSSKPILGSSWKTTDGIGDGAFQSEMTGLSAVKYYIRAYGVIENKTYYGNEIEFDISIITPKITSQNPTEITVSSAKIQTNINYAWSDNIIEKGLCWGTSKTPDIDKNNKIIDASTSHEFSNTLTSLNLGISYYARGYAINKHGTFYGNQVQILVLPKPVFSQVNDSEGNKYKTVVIGSQTWMAENLMATKYSDGSIIESALSESEFKNTQVGAYTVYPSNTSNSITYGYLYNGYAIENTKNVCMDGWRVPTPNDWDQLASTLGGVETAGGRMKAVSNKWLTPNTSATDESGFSGLPGGSYCRVCLSNTGTFADIGTDGYWWSSQTGYFFYLTNNLPELRSKSTAGANDGLSVRCIKN